MERWARLASGVLFLAAALVVLAEQLSPSGHSGRVIELVARQPAAGGWSPERIIVNRGERVRLRIRSEDVVHGFAIGRLGVDAGAIEPGKVVTVEFVPTQSGTFTFYCTMWCDPNPSRMRGILEVRDPAGEPVPAATSPQSVALRKFDMPHEAPTSPSARPEATRGRALFNQGCAGCHLRRGEDTWVGPAIGHREFLQDRSPVSLFRFLRGLREGPAKAEKVARSRALMRSVNAGQSHERYSRTWSDQDRWDAVAYLWSLSMSSDRLDLGRRLYRKNCAPCHGERGKGDGPGGRLQPKVPAEFSEPRTALGGTSALHAAKIRRGDMGTGMPDWGDIFTEEELAGVADYLWTFSLGIRD